MMKRKNSAWCILLSWLMISLTACQGEIQNNSSTANKHATRLPYLGLFDIEFVKTPEGQIVKDSIPFTVPKFSFTNQDSLEITQKNYEGSIYLVDYFFTNCPSICPVMSSQLARIQELLKKDNLWGDIKILSHTVDPDRDSPEVLKRYGEQLGADFVNWNFVTGTKEDLYYQAKQGYFLTALPSDTAAGGFFHSDQVMLIDRYFHIRGAYDGTQTKSMDQLFEDIKILLDEQPAH